MRSRIRDGESDSLELLLDTICNVFGGIILMAILVVLQTQTAAGRVARMTRQQEGAALVNHKMQAELARLERQRDELLKQKQTLTETFRAAATPSMEALLDRRAAFLRRIAQAQTRLDEIRDHRQEAASQAAQFDKKWAELEDLKTQTKEKSERLEEQIRNAIKPLPKTVRLPRQHAQSAFRQLNYMVLDAKVFPFDPSHCEITETASAMRVRPKPDGGIAVPAEGGDLSAFLATLGGSSPRTHFMSFWVCGTSRSFQTFQNIRNAVVDRRYEYSVGTYAAGQDLMLGRGRPPVE